MTTVTPTPLPIVGLHHVTAITADAQQNIDFYTHTLGLRLVKVTINYDDPGSFHLYYGDGLGRPGTLMTHFAWPNARRGSTGTGHTVETAFAIPTGAATFWQERLASLHVSDIETSDRFGHPAITFVDPDGMQVALIETPDATDLHLWQHGQVPTQYAIRGFHGVTLAETTERDPASVLVDRFGYRETARHGRRIRYEAPAGADAGRYVDVVLVPAGPSSRMGAGQVHHIAFRTPTDDQQAAWLKQLRVDGHNVSPVMDRDYFHSIYFREPGGVLFEIATDAPGMTVNEPAEELGSHINLPAWLEPQRKEVEAVLPKITLAPRYDDVHAGTSAATAAK